MRIGLVVDSACDLPGDYLRKNDFTILPITVRIGDEIREDQRDEQVTLDFLRSHIAEQGATAETMPFSVEQITDLFLKRLVIDYDYVFCMTITRTRSPIYDNALQASYAILNEYRPIRAAAGHDTPFALRVIDTGAAWCARVVNAVKHRARVALNGQRMARGLVRATQFQPETESSVDWVRGACPPRNFTCCSPTLGTVSTQVACSSKVQGADHGHEKAFLIACRFPHMRVTAGPNTGWGRWWWWRCWRRRCRWWRSRWQCRWWRSRWQCRWWRSEFGEHRQRGWSSRTSQHNLWQR